MFLILFAVVMNVFRRSRQLRCMKRSGYALLLIVLSLFLRKMNLILMFVGAMVTFLRRKTQRLPVLESQLQSLLCKHQQSLRYLLAPAFSRGINMKVCSRSSIVVIPSLVVLESNEFAVLFLIQLVCTIL